MENRNRNREYLKQHYKILKDQMNHILDGQPILYIVKDIMLTDLPMEECRGFKELNEFLNELNRQHKIEYFMQHIESLQRGLDNEKTLLFAMKEALVSKQPLEDCPGYDSLQEYFKQENILQTFDEQQASFALLKILSDMVNIMTISQDSEQIGKIISYYPYIRMKQREAQKKISYTA